jgi:hypothetical protein
MEEINKKEITENSISIIQKYIDNHKSFCDVIKHRGLVFIEDIEVIFLFLATNNHIELYFKSGKNIDINKYIDFVFDNLNINLKNDRVLLYNNDLENHSGIILSNKEFEEYKLKKQLENF